MSTKSLTRAFQLMFRGESKMFEIPCPVPFPECHAPFEGDIAPCSKCGGRGWVVGLALFAVGCDTTTAKVTTAQLKAESYTCSPEEVKSMKAYYATCMDGVGYFSNYCLDRAVLATCHPREPKP